MNLVFFQLAITGRKFAKFYSSVLVSGISRLWALTFLLYLKIETKQQLILGSQSFLVQSYHVLETPNEVGRIYIETTV